MFDPRLLRGTKDQRLAIQDVGPDGIPLPTGVLAPGKPVFDKTLGQFFFGDGVTKGGRPVQARDNAVAGFYGDVATEAKIDGSGVAKPVVSATIEGARCAVGKVSPNLWKAKSVNGQEVVLELHSSDGGDSTKTDFFLIGDSVMYHYFYDLDPTNECFFTGSVTDIDDDADELTLTVPDTVDVSGLSTNPTYGATLIRSAHVGESLLGAHAEGSRSVAANIGAHAEGAAIATGGGAHAEGQSTASGAFSHAEGVQCKATDAGSHAEGSGTTASGQAAHAEGFNTTASGSGAHAGGIYAVAKRPNEWARGFGFDPGSSRHHYGWSQNTTTATPINFNLLPNLDDNTLYDCNVVVTATKSDGSAVASYHRRLLVKRVSGTVSLVSSVQTIGTDIEDGSGASGWDIALSVNDSTKAIVLTVTGQSSTTIRWFGFIEWSERSLS